MKQNSVQLIGYVGSYPKIKMFDDGGKKASLRVATHDQIKNKNGERKYSTVWHDVVAWDEHADYAECSFVRGSHVLVGGSIVYRNYMDSSGHARYITEIKAHTLINLDR